MLQLIKLRVWELGEVTMRLFLITEKLFFLLKVFLSTRLLSTYLQTQQAITLPNNWKKWIKIRIVYIFLRK